MNRLIIFLLSLLSGIIMTFTNNTYALEIITIEQPASANILQKPAKAITFPLNNEDVALIKAMEEKLYQLGGVGLAAPQVNHHKQIIAIYIPEDAALLRDNVQTYPMHILINPSYQGIEQAGMTQDFEGCYSVSSKAGKVPRYNQIRVHFYDENGQQHHSIESGFYARVLQHEIDHLQGTLITDRLTPDCIQGNIDEMMALRRSELSEKQKVLFDELMKKKLKK